MQAIGDEGEVEKGIFISQRLSILMTPSEGRRIIKAFLVVDVRYDYVGKTQARKKLALALPGTYGENQVRGRENALSQKFC